MIETLVITILFLIGLYYILSPYFTLTNRVIEVSSPYDLEKQAAKDSLLLQKEEVLMSLEEYELDREMKKISESDYQELYNEALSEGSQVLEDLDKINQNNSLLELKPEENSENLILNKKCYNCNQAVQDGDKFCSQCGTAL